MLPKDLTKDLKDRLNSLKGQVEGVIKMLDESNDPAQILNQFKAVNKGFDKAQYLLLDEVFRKTLAIKIAEALESCPGNCGQEEKIAVIRKQFPDLNLYELTDKMKEIETIYEFLQTNTEEIMQTITLTIDNMVCQGCAEKITDILKELDGIKKVKTKAMHKSVQVDFNPDKISESKIETTLTKSGYEPKKLII
ncbi:copper chaperone CopZ [Gillisia sp. Hel_I_86]|uniref:metal-sensing transcriptional repressor n=1 Tax=Gillisia sp. Hel_I_86 TaxID=1249981 RepID=UPI00119B8E34|nr:metal-sensing transcriptional repressor [Gillisia sp. Hel_I_86]TVZ26900.1 copper chaperone CopZ [Gillisia sp. Hel_I_86]